MWRATSLREVPGWPLWEGPVHDLLHASFAPALLPIFLQYSRASKHSCALPSRGMSLGLEEWLVLMSDCKVPTRGFELRRLHKLHGACVPAGAPEPRLLPQHFLQALVALALQRANFGWLETAASKETGAASPQPLPGCLAWLLEEHILMHASRDDTPAVLAAAMADDGLVHALHRMEAAGDLRRWHVALQRGEAEADDASLDDIFDSFVDEDGVPFEVLVREGACLPALLRVLARTKLLGKTVVRYVGADGGARSSLATLDACQASRCFVAAAGGDAVLDHSRTLPRTRARP